MKKYFILIVLLFISNFVIACELKTNNELDDKIQVWLGKNSEFSKAYKSSKCALDEVLNNLPVSQRRVIANLIAQSYKLSTNSIDSLLTYNY